ncbi:MAG TPA: hypothetical protein VFU36_02515 [Jatrophihabitans sp.]|nr:hypothetical protein [Jatrophihabitans sp.]
MPRDSFGSAPAALGSAGRGDLLAVEYLDRVIRDRIDAAELTAVADAAPELIDYHGRLMPNPVFLSAADSDLLVRQLDDIHDLLLSLPQRCAGSRAGYARMLGLSEFQVAVVERAAAGRPPLLARADLYRTGTGFALLELNTGSALGGFDCGEINRTLASHPSLAGFVAEKQLSWVDTAERLLGIALAQHAERTGSVAGTIALVDFPDTFPRYQRTIEVMAQLCRRSGIDAFACHLGELAEGPYGLSYRGRKVDIVYRFFMLEYVTSAAAVELLEPLRRAAESGTVTLLSPVEADLYGYKEGLALLSELAHTADFDSRERDSVAALVPWTRRLHATVEGPAGEAVDAISFATAQQSELMLKPVSLHGGSGIVAGWTVGAEEWLRNVTDALDGPYVLQQRVRPVADPVLTQQTIGGLYCTWGVFITPSPTGEAVYGGCFVRGSHDPEVDIISYDNGALIGCCLVTP